MENKKRGDMENERATQNSVALYPKDRNIVERAMETFQRKTFSDALQFIIRDWARKSETESADLDAANGNGKRGKA